MDPRDRERVLVEVVQRVSDMHADPRAAEQILFDTIYEERHRLETEPGGRDGRLGVG
jgi:hypothetical protein